MEYLIVKWLHILSSTVLFGTGIGSAYYMLFTSLAARRRQADPQAVAVVVHHVVKADLWFTTSTIIFQPLSGWYLAHLVGLPLTSTWIVASVALYLVAGACWLPVVWLQLQLRDLAQQAVLHDQPLPPRYFRLLAVWTALGVPAALALLAVFFLMVAKPV
jgi:uncharacterized membrane protein